MAVMRVRPGFDDLSLHPDFVDDESGLRSTKRKNCRSFLRPRHRGKWVSRLGLVPDAAPIDSVLPIH